MGRNREESEEMKIGKEKVVVVVGEGGLLRGKKGKRTERD